MNIEDHIVSPDLAKKLRGLGVKQSGALWYWVGEYIVPGIVVKIGVTENPVAAFTSSELGQMLPSTIDPEPPGTCYWLTCGKMSGSLNEGRWICSYAEDSNTCEGTEFDADTEADARAELLIYLIEKGILKL